MKYTISQPKRKLKKAFQSLSKTLVKQVGALIGGLFGVVSGLFLFAASTTSVESHNLQTRMVYMFLDPDTQQFLDARIDGGHPPGTPLLMNGDELGIIVKVIPSDGTNTGVGGHVTFYVPNGTEVIEAGYLLPGDNDPSDDITGYDKVPMKGQSLITVGVGAG
ncbi:MAG: hypothetical protein KJP04_09920, partial [Arenicella sp.]|nr:hypothetical protein [Arenicella sp.]